MCLPPAATTAACVPSKAMAAVVAAAAAVKSSSRGFRRAKNITRTHMTPSTVFQTSASYPYLAGVEACTAGEEVQYANGRGHRRRHVRVTHEIVHHLPISRQECGNFSRVYLPAARRTRKKNPEKSGASGTVSGEKNPCMSVIYWFSIIRDISTAVQHVCRRTRIESEWDTEQCLHDTTLHSSPRWLEANRLQDSHPHGLKIVMRRNFVVHMKATFAYSSHEHCCEDRSCYVIRKDIRSTWGKWQFQFLVSSPGPHFSSRRLPRPRPAGQPGPRVGQTTAAGSERRSR